jgi:heme exporter protein A
MSRVESIEVRGVTRLYGSTVALRNISVGIRPGAVTFIEGSNGAGKSTLLGVVGTAIRPSQGTVRYPPFGDAREVVRPHLGWVSHEARAYRELTTRENVVLAARLYGMGGEDAWERVASRLDLRAFADQRFATLSRGQKQRAALARALAHEPSVLLLDEPSTGLDRASMERLESLLLEESAKGTIVVVVSHDSGLVARLGGRSIRLDRGRLVHEG